MGNMPSSVFRCIARVATRCLGRPAAADGEAVAGDGGGAGGTAASADYALKLNELALTLSAASMFNMSMYRMNSGQGSQPAEWVSTPVLLLFLSFTLSLAGVLSHPMLEHRSAYVGKAALAALFTSAAVTAISVLPKGHNVIAKLATSLFVVLFTCLMFRGWPWRRHPRGQKQEGTVGTAAAAPETVCELALGCGVGDI